MKHTSTKVILYDNIQLITPDKREELLADLTKRTGIKIEKFEIGPIDFLRDVAYIKIYYQFDGCDFCYFTNDKDKLFFKEQYIIDIPTDDTYYYSELSEVLAVASELTGQTLTTKEEITDAFEDYEMQMQEVNPDYLISFYEYEFEE